MKKILFLLTLSLCSLGAWASFDFSDNSTGQTLYYTISGTTVTVTYPGSSSSADGAYNGFAKPTGALEIPASVTYNNTTYSVTSISTSAFYKCSGLTSVTIPNSVTSIGNDAFRNCNGLTSVTIPNSVASIGTYAFYQCSGLTSVTIGNSVTSIGSNAFQNCSGLTSVNYTGTIGDWCGITFGNYTANPLNNTNANSLYINGVLQETITIPNSVTTIGNNAFYGYTGLKSVTIPNSVTSIKSQAFYGCTSLTSVTIGNSVTSIGSNAFQNCSGLTSVTIPSSVTSIGNSAFKDCTSLASVVFNATNCTSMANNSFNYPVFSGCTNIASLTIGENVRKIPSYAFYGCSGLTSVTIPNSVTSIGTGAFSYCSNMKTVYNLSTMTFSTSGFYGTTINRVIVPTTSGTGTNKLLQIPEDYSVVDDENEQEYNIPSYAIPANFIYKDGGSWLAKEIILIDDTNRFNAPVAFTADTVTYTREFTNGNRSTLYLPFDVASIPNGLTVYDFSEFSGSSISFAEHTGDIDAYTPYLVVYELAEDGISSKCTFSLSNVTFSATPTSPAGITYNGMTFQGTTKRTCMTNTNYGYSNGYFVQSGNGTDHSGHAHVNPFRCYFTYSGSAPMGLPPTLDIDLTNNGLTGIVTPDKPVRQHNIRYSDDVYDTMGRLVRKHAKDLEGLPKGIYIWKGQKVLHFQ